ncbi:MAG: hypothetical protein ACLFSJ_03140 [Halorhodospira sp.]
MQRIYRLIALGAITLATAAGAADSGNGEEESSGDELPPFSEVDQNEDGELSLEEAKAVGIQEDTFEREDLDNDGKVSEIGYKYGIK